MEGLRRVVDHFQQIVFVVFARRLSFARQRNSDARRDVLDRLRKGEAPGESAALEDVAARAAAEAVEETLATVDGERRRLLPMKRAEALVRPAGLLERRDLGDEFDDVRRLAGRFDELVVKIY